MANLCTVTEIYDIIWILIHVLVIQRAGKEYPHIMSAITMTWSHAEKRDASVCVTFKPSHSLPTMTSKSVLIP